MPAALEAALRHDRQLTLVALCAVVVASWAWVLTGAGIGMSAFEMTSLGLALGPIGGAAAAEGAAAGRSAMTAMAAPAAWDAGYWALMVAMWWVMMLAMMLPSAAPTILLFAALRRRSADRWPARSAVAFAAAYGAAWLGFSLAAASLQWAFEGFGVLSPQTMSSTSVGLAALLLLAAGLYQFSALKQACLHHCRAPAEFLSAHWRKGTVGAFRMGLAHGLYCLGCCWALMTLLFFGGVMNLWWIGGLALLVLLEKLAAGGVWFGRAAGALLLAAGVAVLGLAADGMA